MNLLALFLILIAPIYGLLNWALARRKLVRHLANEYPHLWLQLKVGDAMGEVGGYSSDLTRWVARREYLNLEDPLIPKLATNYQRSKIIGVV